MMRDSAMRLDVHVDVAGAGVVGSRRLLGAGGGW